MISSCRLLRGMPEPKQSFPVSIEEQVLSNETEPHDLSDAEDPITEAYRRGYQEGYAACVKASNAEISKQVGAFRTMVEDLASQRGRLIRESEESVLRIACKIANRIVGKIAEIKEDLVIEMVRNAVSRLAERQKIIVRVNPGDAGILEKVDKSLFGSYDGFEIKADPRIKRGGCLIEGEFGIVDAELDRQIDVIEKALVGASR
ncbi:MAG: FliH/SctL family protein [bacterium]